VPGLVTFNIRGIIWPTEDTFLRIRVTFVKSHYYLNLSSFNFKIELTNNSVKLWTIFKSDISLLSYEPGWESHTAVCQHRGLDRLDLLDLVKVFSIKHLSSGSDISTNYKDRTPVCLVRRLYRILS